MFICLSGYKKNVTYFHTMGHFDTSVTRKSSNSLDPLMTAEGPVGAPTCLYVNRVKGLPYVWVSLLRRIGFF
jgi:hypothetical protein